MVVGALCRKIQHGLNATVIIQPHILKDLEHLDIELVTHGWTFLIDAIKLNQQDGAKLQRIRQNLEIGKSPGFVVHREKTFGFQNWLCVPNKYDLKEKILVEAYNTRYLVHLERYIRT